MDSRSIVYIMSHQPGIASSAQTYGQSPVHLVYSLALAANILAPYFLPVLIHIVQNLPRNCSSSPPIYRIGVCDATMQLHLRAQKYKSYSVWMSGNVRQSEMLRPTSHMASAPRCTRAYKPGYTWARRPCEMSDEAFHFDGRSRSSRLSRTYIFGLANAAALWRHTRRCDKLAATTSNSGANSALYELIRAENTVPECSPQVPNCTPSALGSAHKFGPNLRFRADAT